MKYRSIQSRLATAEKQRDDYKHALGHTEAALAKWGDNDDMAELKVELVKRDDRIETLEGVLSKAYRMVNTEKGYCPQCGDGSGAYYDNHGSVCQCQWCYEANQITHALKPTT
jgi:hypothetical protein